MMQVDGLATARQLSRRVLLPALMAAACAGLLCGATLALRPGAWWPEPHSALLTNTVYAYRQWQSTGLMLHAGDRYRLRASGQWLYSPIVGLHGPRGGWSAVTGYPMPRAPGGALLGRIGPDGPTFYVGAGMDGAAESAGILHLRINDDLLGDNSGTMDVKVEVWRATQPAP